MSTELFYSIGQVASHTNLPQSVLRYWETVFDRLQPHKSAGGSRQYSQADVELVKKIKKLLYDQGFTIKGANKLLNSEPGQEAQPGPPLGETRSVSGKAQRAAGPEKKGYSASRPESTFDEQSLLQELKNVLKILERE